MVPTPHPPGSPKPVPPGLHRLKGSVYLEGTWPPLFHGQLIPEGHGRMLSGRYTGRKGPRKGPGQELSLGGRTRWTDGKVRAWCGWSLRLVSLWSGPVAVALGRAMSGRGASCSEGQLIAGAGQGYVASGLPLLVTGVSLPL